jgi:prepilin-type processing-associated H-X9-DG protein
MRPQQRDFTLIELFVILALIVILAAILFPVFALARENARQAVCLSNLRQLATAMHLYSEDHDGLFPLVLARQPAATPLFPTTWMGRLQPYLNSTAVFVDAASGRLNQDWQTSDDLLANYSYPPSRRAAFQEALLLTVALSGTAMWEGIGGYSGPPVGDYGQSVPSRSQAEIARPAETILLCDHQVFDWGMLSCSLESPTPRHLREPDGLVPDGTRLPQGMINAAFVDGHVKALKHAPLWAILADYSRRGRPVPHVFRHFWPYE